MPDLGRTALSAAWLTRAGANDGCRGSFDRWAATSAHAADEDRQIEKLPSLVGCRRLMGSLRTVTR